MARGRRCGNALALDPKPEPMTREQFAAAFVDAEIAKAAKLQPPSESKAT